MKPVSQRVMRLQVLDRGARAERVWILDKNEFAWDIVGLHVFSFRVWKFSIKLGQPLIYETFAMGHGFSLTPKPPTCVITFKAPKVDRIKL